MRTAKSDSQQRKDLILGIVVNEYIKNINPVSSQHVAQEYNLDLSTATIRNILAELEKDGMLTHPHTSAGRIPTPIGYRYYVDNLMHEIQLLEGEKSRIKAEYEKDIKDLQGLLEKTPQVISDVTHYTSIVSIDGQDRIFYRGASHLVEYDFQDIRRVRDILDALERKERILQVINRGLEHKIQIYIDHEIAYANMDGCSLAISQYQVHDGPSGRIAVLGPIRMDYQRVVSTLTYITDLMARLVK